MVSWAILVLSKDLWPLSKMTVIKLGHNYTKIKTFVHFIIGNSTLLYIPQMVKSPIQNHQLFLVIDELTVASFYLHDALDYTYNNKET